MSYVGFLDFLYTKWIGKLWRDNILQLFFSFGGLNSKKYRLYKNCIFSNKKLALLKKNGYTCGVRNNICFDKFTYRCIEQRTVSF